MSKKFAARSFIPACLPIKSSLKHYELNESPKCFPHLLFQSAPSKQQPQSFFFPPKAIITIYMLLDFSWIAEMIDKVSLCWVQNSYVIYKTVT